MTEILIENNEGLQSIPNDKFGVYAIVFYTDHGQKIYIGSTAESFHGRLRRHLGLLKKGKHPNPYMQGLWNRHKAFRFEILKIINSRDLVVVEEQKYIDQLCEIEKINFGPALPSPRLGIKHTPETREKISHALKGKPGHPHSAETREKMSQAAKGRIPSTQCREALVKTLKGKRLSSEHRARISAGLRKPETLARISASSKGRVVSIETRIRHSNALKGRIRTAEHCQNLSKAMIGKKASPEARLKMSLAARNRKKAEAANV